MLKHKVYSTALNFTLAIYNIASCPGSNYAGEGKRAWYLLFAVTNISKEFLGNLMRCDALFNVQRNTMSYVCMSTH